MKKPHGFTLVELLITTIITGILFLVFAPAFSRLAASQKRAYIEQAKMNNQSIALALLSYAATSTTLGVLPAPYSGSGYTNTVYNPGDVSAGGLALTQALNQNGLTTATAINDDGTPGSNVRVYQLVNGLTLQTPLYFNSGQLVTLTYQLGAIYMSGCPKSDASCNPNSGTGIPGSSSVLTSANYATWNTAGTDLEPYIISTLPLQKNMLITTVQRLDRTRDALLGYVANKRITAAAGDTSNMFPTDSPSQSGKTPGSNQGCRDGWYSLKNSTILAQVSLSANENGQTAWGGDIEYCRDYDVTGTKGANVFPQYAAIRINASVSSGISPSPTVVGNNVILTL